MSLSAVVGRGGDGAADEAAVARAWALLVDSSDAIADSITLTLLERDAEVYERIGPELRADVRASCRQHIQRGLTILSRGARGAGQRDRPVARDRSAPGASGGAAGARAARLHRGRPDALGGAGGARRRQRRSGSTSGCCSRPPARVWSNLDIQNAVLIDSYRRESARLHRQDLQRQQATLDALLEGRGGDPAYVEEARAALDIGADDDLACVRGARRSPTPATTSARSRTGSTGAGIGARWHVRSGVYFGLLFGDLPDEEALVRAARRRTRRPAWGWRAPSTGWPGSRRRTCSPTVPPRPCARRAAGGLGRRPAARGADGRQPPGHLGC